MPTVVTGQLITNLVDQLFQEINAFAHAVKIFKAHKNKLNTYQNENLAFFSANNLRDNISVTYFDVKAGTFQKNINFINIKLIIPWVNQKTLPTSQISL